MEQYINKSAVVAEIERKYETNLIGAHSAFRNGKIEALREVKDFLDTLEVKDANEALRTEYEKGRHDVIEKAMVWLTSHMKWGVVSWDDKEECVRSFKEAMKE